VSVLLPPRELTEPPPELKFRRRVPLRTAVLELWRSRALLLTLAERDLRVRYKQAALGFAWAIVQPIVLLVAFTILFEHAAHINTHGVPYPLFSYLGLLPWTFFSETVSLGANSVIGDKALLNKVHFPREAFPLADTIVALTDLCMASVALLVLFGIERYLPRATVYWVPLLIPIVLAFAVGVSLVMSACMVYFRDVGQVLPIVLQIGLFISPVAYSFSVIPARFQALYAIVNPLGPVIDSLRRTVLMGLAPRALPLVVAALSAAVYLIGGYKIFKRLELGFADVA
jgi:ABC-type polysaccharide/polyol phosphate export permease